MGQVQVVVHVSVVMPCLNEAEAIGSCVDQARTTLERHGTPGEIIVVDNGSEDGSAQLARQRGALVITEPRRGYGSAYLAGLAAASGQYIVMADGDGTYDLGEIPRFVAALEDGADVVIGDRMDHIHDGAMPWLHRRIGNPAMSRLLDRLFDSGVRDAWCGMRAVRRDALPTLALQTHGMELALEMIVRATRERLVIGQIPIELRPRVGDSKLSPRRDGWRALKWMISARVASRAQAGPTQSGGDRRGVAESPSAASLTSLSVTVAGEDAD